MDVEGKTTNDEHRKKVRMGGRLTMWWGILTERMEVEWDKGRDKKAIHLAMKSIALSLHMSSCGYASKVLVKPVVLSDL